MLTQMELLKKYQLTVRGFSGQHLLVDPNLQKKTVDLLELKSQEPVLEIGPGLGALTHEILCRGAKVTGVEKDRKFIDVLTQEFQQFIPSRLTLVHGDVLKTDLAEVYPKKRKFKVIGNLPYYITAPILFHLVKYRHLISLAVLTMQKEVAARLMAVPGNKDYGRLTLGIRLFAEVHYAFTIRPSCFTPKPEVNSSVVVLRFLSNKDLFRDLDEKLLFYLIKIAFQQRRKTLLHILSRDNNLKGDRGYFCEVFEHLQLPLKVRGEELLIKDYVALTEGLQKNRPAHGGRKAFVS